MEWRFSFPGKMCNCINPIYIKLGMDRISKWMAGYQVVGCLFGRIPDIYWYIFGQKWGIEPYVRPDTRYLAIYLIGNRISSHIWAVYRISDHWFDPMPAILTYIRPDTGYLAIRSVGYRISGNICGRIPDIWPHIRSDTGYLDIYLAGYGFLPSSYIFFILYV